MFTLTMSSTEYRKALGRVYGLLTKAHLVRRGVVDEGTLQYFVNTLNKALPTNATEEEVAAVVKELYFANRHTLNKLNMGNGYGIEKYVLLTNAQTIRHHFNLPNSVVLKWDRTDRQYTVGVHSENTAADASSNWEKPEEAMETDVAA